MPILFFLFLYMNADASPAQEPLLPEIKHVSRLMREQIVKVNQAAKQNRKILKEAHKHPKVTKADIKQLQKVEADNLRLIEETEKLLKNQKH